MKFPSQMKRGRLVRRYKRFLADITLDDGEEITAHCANPGSMMGVAVEGAPVWVSEHRGAKRKLNWSWQLTEIDGALIPINTSNANAIVAEALAEAMIPELAGYGEIRREVKYGENSRIDFLLDGKSGRPPCYVEAKNVHLRRQAGLAEFPDSVTSRGAKHLRELAAIRQGGARAVMAFVVQRSDCRRFSPARDLDPAYGRALQEAVAAKVELLCYDCEITTQEVVLRRALPIDLYEKTNMRPEDP